MDEKKGEGREEEEEKEGRKEKEENEPPSSSILDLPLNCTPKKSQKKLCSAAFLTEFTCKSNTF
jgi:hypothetical protein